MRRLSSCVSPLEVCQLRKLRYQVEFHNLDELGILGMLCQLQLRVWCLHRGRSHEEGHHERVICGVLRRRRLHLCHHRCPLLCGNRRPARGVLDVSSLLQQYSIHRNPIFIFY